MHGKIIKRCIWNKWRCCRLYSFFNLYCKLWLFISIFKKENPLWVR